MSAIQYIKSSLNVQNDLVCEDLSNYLLLDHSLKFNLFLRYICLMKRVTFITGMLPSCGSKEPIGYENMFTLQL